jgi:hypothetical protein
MSEGLFAAIFASRHHETLVNKRLHGGFDVNP